MQEVQISLYNKAKKGGTFNHLYNKVFTEKNLRFAMYRVGSNPGRNTPGPNGTTYGDLLGVPIVELKVKVWAYAQKNYHKGREVLIPKDNGKMRKLGIVDIELRILQQCVANILEAVVEPNFSKYSFGFRRNLQTKDAIARISTSLKVNRNKATVWDVDLKSYFDTVELEIILSRLREIHNIKDWRFVNLIKRCMQINILTKGGLVNYKGVGLAQGTILGPILSNVMLDDLNQLIEEIDGNYELGDCRHSLYYHYLSKGRLGDYKKKNGIPAIMVRYADDFVIICKRRRDLEEIQELVYRWVKNNKLEINEEKSKVIPWGNGKRSSLEFLGFKLISDPGGFMVCVKDPKKTWAKCKKTLFNAWRSNDPHSIIKMNMMSNFCYYDICSNLKWLVELYDEWMYNQVEKGKRRSSKCIPLSKKKGTMVYQYTDRRGTLQEIDVWRMRNDSNISYASYIKSLQYWDPNKLPNTSKSDLIDWCSEYIEFQKEKYFPAQLLQYAVGLAIKQRVCPIMRFPLTTYEPSEIVIHHIKALRYGGTNDFKNLIFMPITEHNVIHGSKPVRNYMPVQLEYIEDFKYKLRGKRKKKEK